MATLQSTSLHLSKQFFGCIFYPPVSLLSNDVLKCSPPDIQEGAPAGKDNMSASSLADSDDCIILGTATARKVSVAAPLPGGAGLVRVMSETAAARRYSELAEDSGGGPVSQPEAGGAAGA